MAEDGNIDKIMKDEITSKNYYHHKISIQTKGMFEEKEFILRAIESGKTVVGICLGSQLIAEVLGARVYPNKQKEIGWFDIHKTEFAKTFAFGAVSGICGN